MRYPSTKRRRVLITYLLLSDRKSSRSYMGDVGRVGSGSGYICSGYICWSDGISATDNRYVVSVAVRLPLSGRCGMGTLVVRCVGKSLQQFCSVCGVIDERQRRWRDCSPSSPRSHLRPCTVLQTPPHSQKDTTTRDTNHCVVLLLLFTGKSRTVFPCPPRAAPSAACRFDVHHLSRGAAAHAAHAAHAGLGALRRREEEVVECGGVGRLLECVLESLGEHLAREGVVGLEREALVVELDRLVQVATQVLGKAEGRVGGGDPRRDGEGGAVPLDGFVEEAQLAVGVAQVEDGRLARGGIIALRVLRHLQEEVSRLLVLAVMREVQVVGAQVLDADAQPRHMAAREEAGGRAVGCHRLVALVLRGEGVTEAYPRGGEAVVERGGLGEVTACTLVVCDEVVVGAHCEPRHGLQRIVLDELVGEVEEVRVQVEVHHRADVHGQHRLLEGVLLAHLARQLVAGEAVVVGVLILRSSQQHVRVGGRHQRRLATRRRAPLRLGVAAPPRLHSRRAALTLAALAALATHHPRRRAALRCRRRAAILPRLRQLLACRGVELAPVEEQQPLRLRRHQLGLQRLEQRLLLARRQHVVSHEPVERLIAHRVLLQGRGVAARGERPVLLRLVHAAPQELHRCMHRHLPARAHLSLGLLQGLVVDHRKTLVPIAALGEALGGEVAEARARRLQLVLAQHGERAPELLGVHERLR
eukprot:scaffold45757_cov68-Phaeocystis_antarctica.AAC.1